MFRLCFGCVLIVFWCVLMCFDVFWCVLLCFAVFWSVLMYFDCVLMCFGVLWCVLIVFWLRLNCVLMCFDVFWLCFDVFWLCFNCVLMCFDCVLMCFDVFWYVLIVFWLCFDCVLIVFWLCFDVFWLCFDVFWCVLMCFDVFWCVCAHWCKNHVKQRHKRTSIRVLTNSTDYTPIFLQQGAWGDFLFIYDSSHFKKRPDKAVRPEKIFLVEFAVSLKILIIFVGADPGYWAKSQSPPYAVIPKPTKSRVFDSP